MTRAVAARLGILAAIVVAGLAYLYFDVLQYHLVAQPYTVTVAMPRAGGLYQGGYVAYRGVDVGRVVSFAIDGDHVDTRLSIDPGVRIPRDCTVTVHDLSALGEEYVDFVPRRAGAPYLRSGSHLAITSAAEPIDAATLLGDATRFASSVDTGQVDSLLATVDQAVAGTGSSLHQVLTASRTLVAALQQVQPQTATDIVGGNVLLQTGLSTNSDLQTYAANLAQLTARLQQSNPDIEALFANGQAATGQLQALISADSGPIERLTTTGDSATSVLSGNIPAVQALLSIFPRFANDAGSLYYDGALHGDFVLNPGFPVCTYGSAPLPLPTAPASPVSTDATCPTSAPDLLQRGAANAPGPQP